MDMYELIVIDAGPAGLAAALAARDPGWNIFIENGREHGPRIVEHILAGRSPKK